ncbi:response regulator [Primorskyibacter sp. 2E107]|uniref:response regulator n=1 Tax=Primorskyibacter sp. 2E107 TaxID=3403458 RepID=UPI003AF71720
MTLLPLTCLIVADSETERFQLRWLLMTLEPDLRILMVASLEEAWRTLRTGPVDFVLLDNSPPDGNSADFVRRLSQDRRLSSLPVLIITGWPSPFLFAKAKMVKVKHVVDMGPPRSDAVLGLFRDCIVAARKLRGGSADGLLVLPVSERHRARQRRGH